MALEESEEVSSAMLLFKPHSAETSAEQKDCGAAGAPVFSSLR